MKEGKMDKCNKKYYTATLKQVIEQKPFDINDAVKIAQKTIHSNFNWKKRPKMKLKI